MSRHARAIFKVLGQILWRSFGLLWAYLPAGLGVGGGITYFTHNPVDTILGGLAGWLSACLQAYREIGKEIASTGKVTANSITKGFNIAVDQVERAIADKEKQ